MKKKMVISGLIGIVAGFLAGIYAMLKLIIKLELLRTFKEKIVDGVHYLLFGSHIQIKKKVDYSSFKNVNYSSFIDPNTDIRGENKDGNML